MMDERRIKELIEDTSDKELRVMTYFVLTKIAIRINVLAIIVGIGLALIFLSTCIS